MYETVTKSCDFLPDKKKVLRYQISCHRTLYFNPFFFWMQFTNNYEQFLDSNKYIQNYKVWSL